MIMTRQESSDVRTEIGREIAGALFDKWSEIRYLSFLLMSFICLVIAFASLDLKSGSTVTFTVAQTYTKTGQDSVTGM
jgi:hypothetical protein